MQVKKWIGLICALWALFAPMKAAQAGTFQAVSMETLSGSLKRTAQDGTIATSSVQGGFNTGISTGQKLEYNETLRYTVQWMESYPGEPVEPTDMSIVSTGNSDLSYGFFFSPGSITGAVTMASGSDTENRISYVITGTGMGMSQIDKTGSGYCPLVFDFVADAPTITVDVTNSFTMTVSASSVGGTTGIAGFAPGMPQEMTKKDPASWIKITGLNPDHDIHAGQEVSFFVTARGGVDDKKYTVRLLYFVSNDTGKYYGPEEKSVFGMPGGQDTILHLTMPSKKWVTVYAVIKDYPSGKVLAINHERWRIWPK
jgi:hypothetical protein